jgi:hypothetical protein
MKRPLVIASLLVASLYASHAAGQGCSIHTITGTWGFGADGKSLIASPAVDPATYHVAGLVLPGAFAGRVTIHPNGTFGGYYWMNLANGVISGLTPIPFGGPVVVNRDCTGQWSYDVLLPGEVPFTVVERFVIVDQGREIRSIAWATGVPTFTWTLVAQRIPSRCTPGMVQGTYAMQCRGHHVAPELPPPLPSPGMLSSSNLMRFTVEHDGSVEGRLMEKVGPANLEFEFTGTVAVAADCSTAMEITIPGIGVVQAGGIFVENAKRGYGVPMFEQPEVGPAAPMAAVYCELVRMNDRSRFMAP